MPQIQQRKKKLLLASTLLPILLLDSTAQAYQYMNCYDGLPAGYTKENTYEYQTSSYCYNACAKQGAKYFALFDHNTCFCGDSSPESDSSISISNKCNTYCFGFGSEMCGGTSSYSVFSISDDPDNVYGGGNSNANSNSNSDSKQNPNSVDSSSSSISSSSSSPDTSSSSSNLQASSQQGPTTSSITTATDLIGTASTQTGAAVINNNGSPTSQNTASGNTNTPKDQTTTAAGTTATTSPETTATKTESTSTPITTSLASVSVVESVVTSSLVTSVFYSTTYHTEGGSTVYVTNTIIQSTYVTGYIMATGANYNNSGNNNSDHHKMNIKAVVGGVVGGVVGVLIVGIVVLFAVRRYNRKREEDRMEKEYQEAIKPVEYTGTNINDILSISSNGSFSFVDKNNGTTNTNGNPNGNGILDGANSSSNDFGDILRGGAPPKMSNPFDDSRRVSYGSVFYDEPRRNGGHVLTVVNPDQTDYEG